MDYLDVWMKFLVYGNWSWRHPDGRIGKDVVVCDTYSQATNIEYGMRKDHTTHVKIRHIANRKDMPRFDTRKYVVTWRKAEDCPLWLNWDNYYHPR